MGTCKALQPPDPTAEQVGRACRMYGSQREAAFALGVGVHRLKALCDEHDIEPPNKRRAKGHTKRNRKAYMPAPKRPHLA